MRRILLVLATMLAAVLLASGLALGDKPLRNADGITINDSTTPPTTASPYPSEITVSGLSGTIADVNLQLRAYSHTDPDDVDVLLVGPSGANAIVMSDLGFDVDGRRKTLVFDDEAFSPIADGGPITRGSFQVSNSSTSSTGSDVFPSLTFTPNEGAWLNVFDGTDPNGTWQLYVVDDLSNQSQGRLGGWALEIQTVP